MHKEDPLVEKMATEARNHELRAVTTESIRITPSAILMEDRLVMELAHGIPSHITIE